MVSFKSYKFVTMYQWDVYLLKCGYRRELPHFSLETSRLFILTFYTFRTHKMKSTTVLIPRKESVILQHNCFDPGFIAFSCQILLHKYKGALLSSKASK